MNPYTLASSEATLRVSFSAEDGGHSPLPPPADWCSWAWDPATALTHEPVTPADFCSLPRSWLSASFQRQSVPSRPRPCYENMWLDIGYGRGSPALWGLQISLLPSPVHHCTQPRPTLLPLANCYFGNTAEYLRTEQFNALFYSFNSNGIIGRAQFLVFLKPIFPKQTS